MNLRVLVRRIFPSDSTRGRLIRRARRPTLGRVLAHYAATHPDVCFVQIGSHNGVTGDPLYSYIESNPGWSGLMVEPTPQHFVALASLRGREPRFRLVRAAITTYDGWVDMVTIDATAELPWWADQASTINIRQKHTLQQHPALADHLRTITVPAMTFETLTRDLDRIDLIHLDTEGHDAVILDLVDLDRWHPDVLLFEHGSLEEPERLRCYERLLAAGYALVSEDQDTIAIRRWSSFWPRPRSSHRGWEAPPSHMKEFVSADSFH